MNHESCILYCGANSSDNGNNNNNNFYSNSLSELLHIDDDDDVLELARCRLSSQIFGDDGDDNDDDATISWPLQRT